MPIFGRSGSTPMKTALDISTKAREILWEAAKRCPQWDLCLYQMVIEVSDRMTNCAGKAFAIDRKIKLSRPFFADDGNFDAELRETVLHEAAHIIAIKKYTNLGIRIKPHGREWRTVCLALGGKPERCHDMKLAEGFKARKEKMPYWTPVPKTEQPPRKLIQKGLAEP